VKWRTEIRGLAYFGSHNFICVLRPQRIMVFGMAVKTTVSMRMCIRVAGEIKCKDKGYYAEYEERTVGPTSVTLVYPT